MTNTAEALYRFFGQFGLPVDPDGAVPDRITGADGSAVKVQPPYITVQIVNPTWRGAVPFFTRVWYRSESFAAINATVDAIEAAIGEGASEPTPTGAVYIYKGDPFCQYQDMAGDTALKCAYLSMSLQAHTT